MKRSNLVASLAASVAPERGDQHLLASAGGPDNYGPPAAERRNVRLYLSWESMMQPKWFRLLEEQRYGKGLGPSGPTNTHRLGLTVAFLIGALREPPGTKLDADSGVGEIRDLLRQMMTATDENASVVRIYECDKLHEPTACLSDIRSGSLGDVVLLPDRSPSRLYAWPQYFSDDSRDLESITQRLWGLLNEHLRKREFSHRHGSYNELNDDDRAFIERAFARADDDS